jgi:hypothetical protein
MVKNTIWLEAGNVEGYLCIGCLEQRLGRMLNLNDFTSAPVNSPSPWDTARLASRKAET